jgi:4-amino-4-deoxy-L-arabinose transferase-like glycosyltransferase
MRFVEQRGIYLLAFVFSALAVWYGVATPAWEAPDETGHVSYIVYLVTQRQLPVLAVPPTVGQAHHTPLYYMLAALATAWVKDLDNPLYSFNGNPNPMWWSGGKDVHVAQHRTAETFPYRGQILLLHIARLVSAALGLGTVLLLYTIGRAIFPQQPWIALLAAGCAALNPQFLFSSGTVNNDNMVTFATTGALWRMICTIHHPEYWGQWLWLGLWLTVAILSKASALVAAGVIISYLVIVLYRRLPWSQLARGVVALSLPVVLGVGWWFLRNYQLYADMLGWSIYRQAYSALRKHPLEWNNIQHFFTTQLNSFWGFFGWGSVWAPAWFYDWIRLLGWLAIAGIVLFLWKDWRGLALFTKHSALGLALVALIHEVFMLWAITKFDESWYHGRYLFPILAPLMLYGSVGINALMSERVRRPALTGLLCICLVIAVYMPVGVIMPAYRHSTVPKPKMFLWMAPGKLNVLFGDMIALKGHNVTLSADKRQISVRLYWQALRQPDFNYSAFVHLLDETGRILAQQDHAPGESVGYPPAVWWPEDIVEDEHILTVPDATVPGQYDLRVGLYDWQTGERLAVQQDSQSRNEEFVLLRQVNISLR